MRRLIALLVLVGLIAACGTRRPDADFVAAGVVPGAGVGAVRSAQGPTVNASSGTSIPGAATATTAVGPANRASGDQVGSSASGGPAATGPNQASDVGVTETTLRIGTIVAENGLVGNAFQPAVTGLRSWVASVNAQGGIAGRTIELFSCDDREDRARSLECARRLVEENQVFALIATNTRTLGGAAEYLHQQAIPVLGIPINNSFYRFPHFYSIYGSPYVRDGSTVGHNGKIVNYSTQYRYFRTELGLRKAAVINYDIPESAQGGDYFQSGLEAEGFEVTRYTVSFAAPSFDAAVADMQRRGIQLLSDGLDPGANRRLCDAMERRGFTVRAKLTTIVSVGVSYGKQFNDACRPVTYAFGDSRIFTDTSHPLVAAFQQGMARYQRGSELHQWAFEAWIMGEILRDALVKMGPTPTRAGFEEYLRSLRRDDRGGAMTPSLQWVHNDPDLSAATVRDCAGISRWDDAAGGWVAATPFPYCVDDARQYFNNAAEDGT